MKFTSQYINAVGSGNEIAQTQLVVGEIATLVNEKPLTVIQTISATTDKEFTGKTYGDLTTAVAELLNTNEKFAAAMVALVYLNSGIITHEDILRASVGDFSVFNQKIATGKFKNLSGGGFDIVTACIGAVSNITGGALQLAAAKTQSKGAKEVAQTNLETAKTQAESTALASKEATKQALLNAMGAKLGGFSGTTIMVIVGVLALGIAGVYLLSRTSSAPPTPPRPNTPPSSPAPSAVSLAGSTPMHEIGGNITPPLVLPVVQPVQPIIPPLDGIKTS